MTYRIPTGVVHLQSVVRINSDDLVHFAISTMGDKRQVNNVLFASVSPFIVVRTSFHLV
jgi:hypothetical protein